MGQFEKALFHYTVWARHASTQHCTATADASPLSGNLITPPRKKNEQEKQHKSMDGLPVYTFLIVMNALLYLNGYNNLGQIPNLPFLSKTLAKNVIHI